MKKIVVFLSLIVLVGCATNVAKDLDSSVPIERYFRLAQEASDRANYALALNYYQKIYQDFPSQVAKITIAEYEEGFIYFKQRDYGRAVLLFEGVIARFNNPSYGRYFGDTERWVLLLSQTKLDEIRQIRADIAKKEAEKAEKQAEKEELARQRARAKLEGDTDKLDNL
jgi:tetratricopeptide (TPR) repeat protein